MVGAMVCNLDNALAEYLLRTKDNADVDVEAPVAELLEMDDEAVTAAALALLDDEEVTFCWDVVVIVELLQFCNLSEFGLEIELLPVVEIKAF